MSSPATGHPGLSAVRAPAERTRPARDSFPKIEPVALGALTAEQRAVVLALLAAQQHAAAAVDAEPAEGMAHTHG